MVRETQGTPTSALEGPRGSVGAQPGCVEPSGMTAGSHPLLPRLANGPQIRSTISTSYHPTQPWTPTHRRTKSEMALPGPQGSPREPLISATLIKSLGPLGRFPHSSLRPRVAGTRAEAHGASPDTSSLVDGEHSQGGRAGSEKHPFPWKHRLQAPSLGCFPKCPHSHLLPSF